MGRLTLRTTKPFSTISYNTPSFLQAKLEQLVLKRAISFYSFVYHYAEKDERKDHIHLFIIPNGQCQTDAISDLLQEMDLTDPTKPPLGVMPWQSSKFPDWYFYVSHDTAYLASKGQTREYHYSNDDFVTSSEDYFLELTHTVDRSIYAKTAEFVRKAQEGKPLLEMLKNGEIPAPQFNQWASIYSYVNGNTVFRSDRVTHSPKQATPEEIAERNARIDKKVFEGRTQAIDPPEEDPFT